MLGLNPTKISTLSCAHFLQMSTNRLRETETSKNIINLIDSHLTNQHGNDVLSMESFSLIIVVDQGK